MKPLLTLLCASAVLAGVAPAHADPDPADPGGTALLDSLHAAGITYAREDLVITTAETVCTLIAAGEAASDVLAALQARNPGLTTERAGQFMAIAVRSYCPQQLASHGAG